jgi:hypothetical protein
MLRPSSPARKIRKPGRQPLRRPERNGVRSDGQSERNGVKNGAQDERNGVKNGAKGARSGVNNGAGPLRAPQARHRSPKRARRAYGPADPCVAPNHSGRPSQYELMAAPTVSVVVGTSRLTPRNELIVRLQACIKRALPLEAKRGCASVVQPFVEVWRLSESELLETLRMGRQ